MPHPMDTWLIFHDFISMRWDDEGLYLLLIMDLSNCRESSAQENPRTVFNDIFERRLKFQVRLG